MFHEIKPHEYHVEYCSATPEREDVLLCYKEGKILVKKIKEEIVFPQMNDAWEKKERCVYFFSIDDIRFFGYLGEDALALSDYIYEEVQELRTELPRWTAFAGALGHQLFKWYDATRFCGKCGSKMVHSVRERAMCCADCKNTVYPTISPSVIVAITNGDKIVLTKYQPKHSAYQNYALVAGYVESGETVEDAVRREVFEEVGLKVKNLVYYKSQPWPFSGALLFGFFCEVDGSDEITMEEEELREALWVDRKDMPDRSKDVSLTSEMMEYFRKNKKS